MKYLKRITIGVLAIFMMFISINLNNGHFLDFGQEVKAAGEPYYYDKYTVGSEWYLDTSSLFTPDIYNQSVVSLDSDTLINLESTISVDATTGRLYLRYNNGYPVDWLNSGKYYYFGGPDTWPYEIPYLEPGQGIARYMYDSKYTSGGEYPRTTLYAYFAGYAYSKQREIRGTLVQADLIAYEGTYPINGKHTDGYWYVKKGIANQNPIITPSTQGNETFSASAHSAKEVA